MPKGIEPTESFKEMMMKSHKMKESHSDMKKKHPKVKKSMFSKMKKEHESD